MKQLFNKIKDFYKTIEKATETIDWTALAITIMVTVLSFLLGAIFVLAFWGTLFYLGFNIIIKPLLTSLGLV